MSTATQISHPPAQAKSIFHRFLWKEYRMLRGFWLAVIVLGALMQLALAKTMFQTGGIPRSMLLVAWGAAALYAVGAAITLFSAESEERTRDFLLNLPGRWLPMFAAKVSLAVASAFGLGLTLCAVGGWINHETWASAAEFQNAFAVGGVAVLEAIAWGLFFSLWMKQPLLAAVSAIAAASFGAQLAIAATPAAQHAFTLNSYHEAVPLRLLLTLAVFAIDMWLGARWYEATPRRSRRKKSQLASETTTSKAVATGERVKGTRQKVMARLLWQTWRESWKTMLAVVPISLFLMASASLPLVLIHNSTPYADLPTPLLTLLFLPALFGALVFRSDQRGDHRPFLATHAARPRSIWMARHLFWGTGLLAITAFVSIAIWIVIALGISSDMQRVLTRGYGGGLFWGWEINQPLKDPWSLFSHFRFVVSSAMQLTLMSWTSFFTAYALGQCCSLMLRREVLAGLLAVILSIVLVAWVAVTGFWQLSSWQFVLPIGLGAMLATWLRMPAWVVARNRPRSWALPLATIAVPLVLVVARLPSARLAQLQTGPSHQQFVELDRKIEADKSAGQETADAYLQLCASNSQIHNRADREALIKQFVEVTKRPVCRFPESTLLPKSMLYEQIRGLQYSVFFDAQRLQKKGELDAAMDRYLAIVRFQKHRLQRQQSLWVAGELNRSPFELGPEIMRWATRRNQTSERIRKAVRELQSYPFADINPSNAIFADRERIRAVLLDNESPYFFHQGQWRWSEHLAYLANQFPWERQRALLALDIRTKQVLDYAQAVVNGANEYGICNAADRRQLVGQWRWPERIPPLQQAVYGNNWSRFNHAALNARQASTSYLVTQETNKRMNLGQFLRQTLDAQVRRIGPLTQLALIAYRLDHDRYPETLAELSPKYMLGINTDPFSDKPLEYRPQGFDLSLMKYPSNYYRLNDSKLSQTMIPAHTPLLWSVGIGLKEPREGELTLSQDGHATLSEAGGYGEEIPAELEPEEESEENVIKVMYLEPTDRNFHSNGQSQIFTLPNIKPLNPSPTDGSPAEADAKKVEE